MAHIAGWTVAHDVSARDWQFKRNGGQWLLGKTFDGFAPIGPAIVTRDELPDVSNLGIRCLLNGEAVQDSSAAAGRRRGRAGRSPRPPSARLPAPRASFRSATSAA